MRSRNIKPGFFINCELAEVDFASRLLFIGLWCYADREGRFEWKPKQIKAAIFPYDNVNINKLLSNLMSLHVIASNDGVGYIPHFLKHQHPHPHEAKSILPENINKINVIACNTNGIPCQEDLGCYDVRIEDTKIEVVKPLSEYSDDFLSFWNVYPDKTGKGAAYKSWCKKKPPLNIVLNALEWQKVSQKWLEGFIPNPTTYLNQKRWEDEPSLCVVKPKGQLKTFDQIRTENNRQAAREFCGEDIDNDRPGQKAICLDDEWSRGSIQV